MLSIPTPFRRVLAGAAFISLVASAGAASAATAEEAELLKTTLTPLGGERAGNKEGTIPPWTGGWSTPTPGFVNGGRRSDPFAGDKPLYVITSKNMAQYADKLSDGTKAMLQKYPQTFRVDVYPSRRTAAAPQWIYDNTFKNATRAKLVDGAAGPQPEGAFGGTPFPIPKSGAEVMWNHKLTYRLGAFHESATNYVVQANGKAVMVSDYDNDFDQPYYWKNGDPAKAAVYQLTRSINTGPPIRAGEAIVIHVNIDEADTQAWVFLTGQRRVRKLPNSCCDTPTPFSSGLVAFDELSVFTGDMSRFNWKLIGKREMIIPYNSNRSFIPEHDSEMITGAHLNPDHVRWELHRVWVVDATLAPNKRHTSPHSRYYIDEDTWWAVLSDRWDARGQLSRMNLLLPVVMPDVPATMRSVIAMYDLVGGTAYIGSLYNSKSEQIKTVASYPASIFSPDALAADGAR